MAYTVTYTPNTAETFTIPFTLVVEPINNYPVNEDNISITYNSITGVDSITVDTASLSYVQEDQEIKGNLKLKTNTNIPAGGNYSVLITMYYKDQTYGIDKSIQESFDLVGGEQLITNPILSNFGIGDNYDNNYVLEVDHVGSGTKQYTIPFRVKVEYPDHTMEASKLSIVKYTVDGQQSTQTIQSITILTSRTSYDTGTMYFTGQLSVNAASVSGTSQHTVAITLCYDNITEGEGATATQSFKYVRDTGIYDMWYIPSENQRVTEEIDMNEASDLLDATGDSVGMIHTSSAGLSFTLTSSTPYIEYHCTSDFWVCGMREEVDWKLSAWDSTTDISNVVIVGQYIRYDIREEKTYYGNTVGDLYLTNGYSGKGSGSGSELFTYPKVTVGDGNIGWQSQSFNYRITNSEVDGVDEGIHKSFQFQAGHTYYIYPVVGWHGIENGIDSSPSGEGLSVADVNIKVAILCQNTPVPTYDGGGGVIGSIELTNITFNPNNFNIEYDTDSLEAEFSIDVSVGGLYTIDPKKLNIDTFSVIAGFNITGLNVSMNTGATKYENGKLNGSILIQFNPGVTIVVSTTLRVSFEYNDEENNINDTIEGNITFNYLNRSIDLQNMTFNPFIVEYKNGDKTPVTTEFTITYTSQNYTPEKLNVKLISGLLADGSLTNSKFTITTSSIIIDSSTMKGTLSIVPYEYNYMETEFIYNIEIGYEDPDDPTISDSVTQQLTLLRILKTGFTLDRMDISPQTVYYNKNKKTEAQLHVDIYYTKPDDLVIGTDNLKQRGELTIFNIEDMIYHDNIVYLDKTSLENCTDADTGDEGRRFDYIPLLVIDPTQDQYHYLPETTKIILEFWYRDDDNSIHEFKQGEFYLTAGDLYLEYIKYSNNTNEYTVEFNPNSTETHDIISYLGYNMTLTGSPVDPSKVTLSFTREGNSSGEFELIINDIDNEERDNRFYILLRASCNNISDTQFIVNLTYSYIDEYEAINKTITSKITFIPKNSEEFVIEDIRLYPESNTVTKGTNSTIYYYIEYRVDDLSQFTDEDGSINENVRYEHNGNLPYSSGINLINFGESKIIEDAESPGNQRIQFTLEISSNKWQGSGQYTNDNFKVTIYNKFGNSVESEALSIGIYVSLY